MKEPSMRSISTMLFCAILVAAGGCGDDSGETPPPADAGPGDAGTIADAGTPRPDAGSDADENGIPDDREGDGDADGDGMPDAIDRDDDGDRVSDVDELDGRTEFPADRDDD